MLADQQVWVRGAGELGSAVAHLLHRVGFHVFISEISPPLAIRRPVTFSDAILDGESEVEGIEAKRVSSLTLSQSKPWDYIPLFYDDPDIIRSLNPSVIVDARMLKQYDEDFRDWSELFIGLGPGFSVDLNCHRVIETMRGHDLGRVIHSGSPLADTGIPGTLGGENSKRLIRASHTGQVNWTFDFGDRVDQGQEIASFNDGEPILAPISGIIRGMISSRVKVHPGMKIGDIDPRGDTVNYQKISEKARTIASGVFEAIVIHQKDKRQ